MSTPTAYPIKTHLMAHEVRSLPVVKVLEGTALGVLQFNEPGSAGGGWSAIVRHCTDCPEELPLLVDTQRPDGGRFDTFPRCSRHAF